MDDTILRQKLAEAERLLQVVSKPSAEVYEALESYVLANGSRLRNAPGFSRLKAAVEELAERMGRPGPDKLAEGFGANSCAQ